ncbi:MAG: hypothetical protein IKR73_01155, partial [Oscillospiraceae bacterium]|nr:hypothetical protein [Oscillospiraceae bacterium]
MRRIKAAMTAVIAAVMLCACATEPAPDLTVITAAQSTAATEAEDTELHIPEGMETKYFSLEFDKRMQDVYDGVVGSISQFEKTTVIPLTVSTKDYYRILNIVRCEQLGFFFLEDRTIGEY